MTLGVTDRKAARRSFLALTDQPGCDDYYCLCAAQKQVSSVLLRVSHPGAAPLGTGNAEVANLGAACLLLQGRRLRENVCLPFADFVLYAPLFPALVAFSRTLVISIDPSFCRVPVKCSRD